MTKTPKKHKTIQTIINNGLEILYVSHEESWPSFSDFDSQDYEVFICGLPGEKIELNHFKKKKNKFAPRLYIHKACCLLN